MNFKIISKQIYKGFLGNWKLFVMLIFFCASTLAMIFGSLFFLVQFNQEVYQPAINKSAFSVGYLKNNFTYFSDSNSEDNFRTNQDFETYFLDELNVHHESNYQFNESDLISIYEREGYINLVKLDESSPSEQKSAYQEISTWSADYLGNVRFKIFAQFLQDSYGWNFNLWNDQENFVRVVGDNDYLHFYNANLNAPRQGLIKTQQMLGNDDNFISAYINENQFNKKYQLGDLVSLKFLDLYQSKNLQVKIVGTFVDYVNFASREAEDLSLLIDSSQYFNFIKEQNIGFEMINYQSNNHLLSPPVLSLLNNEKFSKPNFANQLNQANQIINGLFFANFKGSSLSDALSQTMYFSLDQRTQLFNLMMIGISFLFLILFFAVLYFLIMQIIKTDLQTSIFLNYQGMSYAEISVIQIFRLTLPLLFSFVLGIVASFGVKYLFWTAFERAFNVHLDLFYFHWMNFLIVLCALFLIFGGLFLLNFLINQKLGKENKVIQRLTFPNWVFSKTKKVFRIKNTNLTIAFSYGAKNFFQFLFFFVITFITFLIVSLSLNFLLNTQRISDVPQRLESFSPQSYSINKGSIIDEETKEPVTDLSSYDSEDFLKKFKPIGADINLKEDDFLTIVEKLKDLFTSEELSTFYLSSLFTKQIDQLFANQINEKNYDDLDDEIKEQITLEQFNQLKIIINNAALLNWQLENNFHSKEGFNINFNQWGTWDFLSGNPTFLNLEGDILDATSNQYLSFLSQCFALNSEIGSHDWSSYKSRFKNLNNPRQPVIFEKTAEQIAASELDKAIADANEGKVVVNQIINAYFPFSYQDKEFLKLKIKINNQISTEIYLKNVGTNLIDNWMPTFILNKKQFYEFIKWNFETYQSKEEIKIPFEDIINNDLNRLDNGVYTFSSKLPFFANNLVLQHHGQSGQDNLTNYLQALETIDVFAINIDQIWWLINGNLQQYKDLIISILIFSSILMVSIYLIVVYLIVKENEGYFQNFKALGYKTREIVSFLLPWYIFVIILSGVCTYLFVRYTNVYVDQTLSQMLNMYLNYQVDYYTYSAIAVIPILFIFLIWWIVHAFVNRIKVTNIVN